MQLNSNLSFVNKNMLTESSSCFFNNDSFQFNLDNYVNLTELHKKTFNHDGLKVNIINDKDAIQKLINDVPIGCNGIDYHTIPVHSKSMKIELPQEENPTYKKFYIKSNCEEAEKIVLEGFPYGQYILNFNCQNITTAKCIFSNGLYVFDLKQKAGNENIKNFRDLSKIDNISICGNFIINANDFDKYKIYIIGNHKTIHPRLYDEFGKVYEECSTTKLYGYVEEKITPFQDNLLIVHPTYQLLLINNSGYNGTIRLKIGHYETNDVLVNDKFVLIRFENSKNLYSGAQNKFLNKDINDSTLNFSCVDKASLIFNTNKNTSDISMVQTYFMTYKYCTQLFAP